MEDHRLRIATAILAYAVQKDTDAAVLCNLSGIDFAAVEQNRQPAITPARLNELWTHASHLSHDLLFGLHLGESLQLAALGIVGEIIKTSSTVGEGITQAAAMAHLFTDLFSVSVEHHTGTFSIQFNPLTEGDNFSFRQTMDMFMAFVVHEMDGLVLEKIKPVAVNLPYAIKDGDLREYERVFRCRPVTRANTWAIQLPAAYWNKPIVTAQYELQQALLQKVTGAALPDVNPQSLQARIYRYLLSNAYLGLASLEDIAANFNVSTRSLQRKLKEEGVSFQQLAEQARKSLALHYIDSGNYQFKEISYMLGYNELSAFTRAFKRWTGTTPASYQKQGFTVRKHEQVLN
ncbi:AraC family transcriptional regulator [Deminuibacter soli]|uniref:AraC family transcriptional regulator n=1 Tax=Deminuibacter soli TaxID=2291815 RepID=A0A3E1NRV8_9BACT|nr:AraC family transcriptional regulator [Deminuibacter soli]RFM30665.1 AraC family transcriptional regulator [Deminuibacter soli]